MWWTISWLWAVAKQPAVNYCDWPRNYPGHLPVKHFKTLYRLNKQKYMKCSFTGVGAQPGWLAAGCSLILFFKEKIFPKIELFLKASCTFPDDHFYSRYVKTYDESLCGYNLVSLNFVLLRNLIIIFTASDKLNHWKEFQTISGKCSIKIPKLGQMPTCVLLWKFAVIS